MPQAKLCTFTCTTLLKKLAGKAERVHARTQSHDENDADKLNFGRNTGLNFGHSAVKLRVEQCQAWLSICRANMDCVLPCLRRMAQELERAPIHSPSPFHIKLVSTVLNRSLLFSDYAANIPTSPFLSPPPFEVSFSFSSFSRPKNNEPEYNSTSKLVAKAVAVVEFASPWKEATLQTRQPRCAAND